MNAADPATIWARLSYRHPLRKYQRLALDALDRLPAGARRFHVVAPPGSGKTVLGLEIARRLARPTLVLCPNTAIREQWKQQFDAFDDASSLAGPGEPAETLASTDAGQLAPLTILTYQSVCNLADPGDLLAEAASAHWRAEQQSSRGLTADEAQAEEARQRRERPRLLRRDLAAGTGDTRLLDLLHPNSRALLDRLQSGGFRAVILDECHHLFSLWGYVVREIVRGLGPETFVVGLTSTPPADLTGDEMDLYGDLLGEPSFQVPTPAVVKEGHLAPYQELAYFVEPLPAELEFVRAQHALFEELVTRVLGVGFASKSLTEWVIDRVRARESGPEVAAGDGGARVSYARFSRQHPSLARAAVRFLHQGGHPLPPEVHLNEAMRQPPDIDDWIVLLEDYCLRCLRESASESDATALETVKRALISLGYVLTRTGIRAYVSPVDRVLALSAAKAIAATDILRRESDALGDGLRALVVTDYEQASAPLGEDLAGVLDRQAGSAVQVLASLVADPFASQLRPMLVTGSGVYCSQRVAESFVEWVSGGIDADSSADRPKLGLAPDSRVETLPDGERVVQILGGATWTTSEFLPLATAYFQAGRSRCLVGTRSLLGEGWDAPRANVLLDLTTAATHTSMHQLRGRTLRVDPSWPDKVANNWDVVCVADLPKGAGDYRRFVRKHRAYYGLTADGTIESGTSHVHPALSPFAPPRQQTLGTLNADLLRRAAGRDEVRAAWRLGEAYENREIPSVRIRSARPLGLAPRQSRQAVGAVGPERLGNGTFAGLAATWAAAGTAVATGIPEVAALGVGALLTAGLVGRFVTRLGAAFDEVPVDLTLDGCARAVLAALKESGLAPPDLRLDAIQIVPRSDGYYRCYLEGADDAASRLFAECLDDLLAPVDNQRYVIPRYYAETSASTLGRSLFVARGLLGGLGLYRSVFHVKYHPVPDYFGANRPRVEVFRRAWNRFVSPGEPVFTYGKGGADLLAAERGRDPFGVLCQLRAIWQ